MKAIKRITICGKINPKGYTRKGLKKEGKPISRKERRIAIINKSMNYPCNGKYLLQEYLDDMIDFGFPPY